MALSPLYAVTSDVDTYFVDKDTGSPLANGILTFYRDIARTVLKPIYTLTGAPPYNDSSYVALPNPLTLSAVGTVQDAGGDNVVIYYKPYILIDGVEIIDLYYIVGTDSGGTEQFTREAWPNIVGAGTPPTPGEAPSSIENQIANPTFTNIFANPNIATQYTVSAMNNQVFQFAPNWDFVISGTGTVSIQVFPIEGDQNVPTSPPYVLDVTMGVGVTSCYLKQRFFYNSGLWASTTSDSIFLSGSFVARNEVAGITSVQMYYQESSGVNFTDPVLIVNGSFTTNYVVVSGSSVEIPESTNTDEGQAGFVDIYLSFTPNSHVQVTSIQLYAANGAALSTIPLDFNSSNRNEAYQGDYYIPRLNRKPTDSFLVGWDFVVNPYQFRSPPITNTPAYIADQTVAQCGTTGNITWTPSTVTRGMNFTATGSNDSFYVLQYLRSAEVKRMIGDRLSANVFAYQIGTGSTVTMRIYLYRAPSTSSIPSLLTAPSTIGTSDINGNFVLNPAAIASGWVSVPRSGLPVPTVTLNQISSNTSINGLNNDYGFNGWQMDPTTIPNTEFFAMVVTFAYTTTNTNITLNSISLVPGDIPCRPAEKTFDEVFRQCQFYYETSYPVGGSFGISPGQIAIPLPLVYNNPNSRNYGVPNNFSFNFKQVKRVNPILYFNQFTPPQYVLMIYWNGLNPATPLSGTNPWSFPITSYTQTISTLAATLTLSAAPPVPIISQYDTSPSGAMYSEGGQLIFHYVADARLGYV